MQAFNNKHQPTWARAGLIALAVLVLSGAGLWVFVQSGGLRQPGAALVRDYWPTDGWRSSSPEGQGFHSAALAEGVRSLRADGAAIDSLLIIRHGYVVLNASFAPYDGTFPHDLASVTKSVTTTLVGIAAAQGKIDLDRPVLTYFPRRAIRNVDARKQAMTLRHLVSMRSGMESGCLADDEGTLDKMRSQPDWVQAALDRPMASEPGSCFCYDSPGIHILSAILQESTGMTEEAFARQVLFEPLGIKDVIWEADPQGYTMGWGNLHLYPRDAAKLGFLFLNHGAWDGRQIVPQEWVHAAAQPISKDVESESGYGYGWWISPLDYYAVGRGGQYVRVIPRWDVIMVATGGDYDFGAVESFLVPSLLGLKKTRPPDPAGLAELEAAAVEAAQEAEPYPAEAPALPDGAKQLTDKIYQCDPNPGSVNSLRFEFSGGETGTLYLTQYGVEAAWPIGLDGKYRLSGQGQAQRGYWQDSHTFMMQIFDIGVLTRLFTFEGNQLKVELPEIPLALVCHINEP
jgi:CubicO group peptidase (beta-lactamase class C family)